MITRHDNGDGTTTFKGVDVTIPTELARDYDVVAVRHAKNGERIEAQSTVVVVMNDGCKSSYPILEPRPTWKPPAFLAPGIYKWANNAMWAQDGAALWGGNCIRSVFRDMPKPTKIGKWQVNEDGTATYLGEA